MSLVLARRTEHLRSNLPQEFLLCIEHDDDGKYKNWSCEGDGIMFDAIDGDGPHCGSPEWILWAWDAKRSDKHKDSWYYNMCSDCCFRIFGIATEELKKHAPQS